MLSFRRARVAAVAATAAAGLTFGVAVPAADAASHTTQEGLINLSLDDTTIQAPIGVAANVCGVAVNLITSSTLTSPVSCDADGVATASRQGRGSGGPTRQSGLVNVAVTDTTVQVPVAVAANVCGVSVNAVAQFVGTGPVTCDALADADADN